MSSIKTRSINRKLPGAAVGSIIEGGHRSRHGPGGPSFRLARPIPLDDDRRCPKNAAVRSLLAPLLAILALAPAPAASAPPATTVAEQLGRALLVPHVSQARSAALAIDLASGTTLYSQHSALALAPASNEKLAVAYAALATLGPAFRIETQVLGVGEQDGTTWRGSITLRGAGDPTLSTGDLRALAAQVRATGIRRIAGPVVGDETWFDARRTVAGWRASFYLGESPPLSALVVDRDRARGHLSADTALAAATAFRSPLRGGGVAGARGPPPGPPARLPLSP